MSKPINIVKNKWTKKSILENIEIINTSKELQCDIYNIEEMYKLLDEMCKQYRTEPCINLPKTLKRDITKIQSQIKKSVKDVKRKVKILKNFKKLRNS